MLSGVFSAILFNCQASGINWCRKKFGKLIVEYTFNMAQSGPVIASATNREGESVGHDLTSCTSEIKVTV